MKAIALRFGIYGLLASIGTFAATQMVFCPMMIVDYKIDAVRYGMLPFLTSAVEEYRKEKGVLPSQEQGLRSLVGISIREVPTDPWGGQYIYRVNGPTFTIYSAGFNGIDEGGGGDDVILGKKAYSCETYGVNCVRPCETIQFVSLAMIPLTFLVLVASFFIRRKVEPANAA